jgi:hypothetical protein
MLGALVADLAAIQGVQVVTTVDSRADLAAPPGIEVVTLEPGGAERLDDLIVSADEIWLVAPETDRCLERLAARVEQHDRRLVGCGAAAIRHASDKAGLPGRLANLGVPHPMTRVLAPDTDWLTIAREVGFPLVLKPAQGAGCSGVHLARDARELRRAVRSARQVHGSEPLLLQRFVQGVPASVSLLADGQRAVALAVNAQFVRASRVFAYRGGETPLDHALSGRAVEMALRTCQALPGLRGYVGVDLVLTESEAVILEVNPRLTTAYLGARAALGENVAALALAASAGALPPPPPVLRSVRFTAAGRIVSTSSHSSVCSRP